MTIQLPPREILSNPPPQYRVLDLFSGIGGFSLGLHRAGFQTAAFCEIEPYCRKILAKHWPGTKIHDDVKQLNGGQYVGAVDVICGGYPCQPFSTAGKQQGEADPRHLWPEMRRIIQQARPRWVIAENVRGHISLGFDTVAAQLEDDGFTIWPFIIPACAVGAAHKRERVWIVAHAASRNDRGIRREIHGENGRPQGRIRPESGGSGEASQPVAHSISPRLEGYAGNVSNRHEPGRLDSTTDGSTGESGLCGAGNSKGRCTEPGLGGSPDGLSAGLDFTARWADGSWEAGIPRVASGVPNRVQRLKALGNAVVPEIPYRIGMAIREYDRQLAKAA